MGEEGSFRGISHTVCATSSRRELRQESSEQHGSSPKSGAKVCPTSQITQPLEPRSINIAVILFGSPAASLTIDCTVWEGITLRREKNRGTRHRLIARLRRVVVATCQALSFWQPEHHLQSLLSPQKTHSVRLVWRQIFFPTRPAFANQLSGVPSEEEQGECLCEKPDRFFCAGFRAECLRANYLSRK